MLLKLAWRNLWRNKKRSIITISSITIAVFLAVFMRTMQLGMYSNMIKNVVGSYVGYVQVHANGYWDEQTLDNALTVTPELLTDINSVNGVENTLQRIESFALGSVGEDTKGVLIQGIEMEKEQQMVNWNNRLIKGRLFDENSQAILLAKGVAKFFKVGVGDTIVFIGQGYHGMSAAGKYKVCGIVDMKNPKINNLSVFMPLKLVQDFLSADGVVTQLVINKSDKADEDKIAQQLKQKLDANQYEVMDWKQMLPELEQTILADSVGGLLMVFILYMIITFGIFGTVLMMTQERTFELGIMLAIGMKRIKLIITLIYETIILTLLGILLGVALVMPLVYYFHVNPLQLGGDQAQVMENFGFESSIPFLFNFDVPFTHGLIIFVISLIITLYPSIKIWKMNPIKAMKR